MSQSSIVKSKSSPCCIGCVILVVVVVGVIAALGIWGYRFYKDNVGLHDVSGVADPSLDVEPDVMFPANMGKFTRQSLSEGRSSEIPGLADLGTSDAISATYSDTSDNIIHAVALPTEEATNLRQERGGPLIIGRGKANAPDIAISMKNPIDKQSTTLTFEKPNWTVMFYTTSTVVVDFLDAYKAKGGTISEDAETTGPEIEATTPEDPPAVVDETPVEAPAPEVPATSETPDSTALDTEAPTAQ